MSALQLLRHIFSTAKSFIGLEGELTADISNWNLRLHDNSTPGGHVFLNRDNSDVRYQARSTELDGLIGFEPQQRGYLVRLGPANYRLRELTVDETNMTITYPDAYDGNTLFGLAASISSVHTFTETQTFESEIQAEGGVRGDVIGNITGNLVGNTTGTHTGNVVGNADGDHTGTFTGSIDTRLGTVQMADDQIVLPYLADDVLTYIAQRGLPPGTIVMWSGAINEVPDGWALCDGANDTPDLTERFVVGAKETGTFLVNNTGGALNHQHAVTVETGGAHSHTGNVGDTTLTIAQMPAHSHGNGVNNTDEDLYSYGTKAAPETTNTIDDNSSNASLQGITETVGGGEPHTHTLTTDEGGEHDHVASSDSKSNLPPYMALAYIMKLPYE